jgi:glyoxylase I family protein
MPRIEGLSHIDLTVSDCDRAARWWQDVLGFTLVHQVHETDYECRTVIHPSGLAVTLMTHSATTGLGAFDERRVGLDHLAFRVNDLDELERWVAQLESHGVPHSGIIDTGYGPTVVMRDPDNIQLEFYVHQDPAALTQLTHADSAEAQKLLRGAT